MAIQPCRPFLYSGPFLVPWSNSFGSASNTTLDADTEYFVYHFIAPASETINRAEFRISSVTASGNIEVSIVTINAANGTPDTLVGSEVALNITTSGNYEVTGLGASLTAGTLYGLRFMVASGVNLALQTSWGGSYFGGAGTYIGITNVSGSAAKSYTSSFGAPVAIGTDAGYRPVNNSWTGPCGSMVTAGISSTGTDFVGNKIVMPFKCRIGGVFRSTGDNASGDISLLIANAAGTVLASRDETAARSGANGGIWGAVHFDADVATTLDVNAGDTIYVLAQATNAFGANIYYTDYRANASLGAQWGTNSFGVSGQVLGTYTEHSARVYGVFPIIIGLDDGVGGGGGLAANPIRGFVA